MVYPDGSETHYAYDAAGRLAGVTDAGGNALAAYAYDNDGRMATHTVGGAPATGAYRYNTRDWVTGIDYPGRFTMNQVYDAAGNVTSQRYRRATTEARKAATFTYDGLHRLKSFRLGSTHARSYAYDDNGNITRVVTGSDTATYAYSRTSTPNRLDYITEGSTTDTFVYDANGSATSVAGTALTYDHRGLVTGYGAYGYTLDAEGYRVKKTGGGSTAYYVRGAGGSVLATYDAGGNLTANYLYAGGDRLARVAGGAVSYYLKDHLGSTRTLLSSAGAAAATYDYWPYGEVLATGGTDATPFRFTGHERDAESGLDFMQYRTYGPERLRFLQVDPAAEKYPGLSPYVYAGGNPLKYWDPDGRWPYTFRIRAFAPRGAFGKSGYHDDKRGFSTGTGADVTSRLKQQFTVDPTAGSLSGEKLTSDPTKVNKTLVKLPNDNEGRISARFGSNDGGVAVAALNSNFAGSNPNFLGGGPDIEVSSSILIVENLENNQIDVSLELTSKLYPASEALIQDKEGNTIFLAGISASDSYWDLLKSDRKKATVGLSIGIDIQGCSRMLPIAGRHTPLKSSTSLAHLSLQGVNDALLRSIRHIRCIQSGL